MAVALTDQLMKTATKASFWSTPKLQSRLGLTLNAEMPISNWRLENGRYWDRTSDNLLVREVLYR